MYFSISRAFASGGDSPGADDIAVQGEINLWTLALYTSGGGDGRKIFTFFTVMSFHRFSSFSRGSGDNSSFITLTFF